MGATIATRRARLALLGAEIAQGYFRAQASVTRLGL
jgi:hypothetical protein